jgi:23S rRNA-/tRNA-specific pseudouridylate synthase
VHLNHVGFPIIGDDRYGIKSQKASKSKKRSRKLYLHAQSLAFCDANDNERIFVAPTPSEFESFVSK